MFGFLKTGWSMRLPKRSQIDSPTFQAQGMIMTNDAELLTSMGTDAAKWAEEFCQRFPQTDQGWVFSWFANAITAGQECAVSDAEAERDKLLASNKALVGALKLAQECIAYCRRAHPDAQTGDGIPVETFLAAALEGEDLQEKVKELSKHKEEDNADT